jgi:hypothetical protein
MDTGDEEIPYDQIIAAIFQFVMSSDSMIGEYESPPDAFASDLATLESYVPG